MTNVKKAIGYILGLIAVLMVFGQASVVGPILDLGFNLSIFYISVHSVILFIAAYYLIK